MNHTPERPHRIVHKITRRIPGQPFNRIADEQRRPVTVHAAPVRDPRTLLHQRLILIPRSLQLRLRPPSLPVRYRQRHLIRQLTRKRNLILLPVMRSPHMLKTDQSQIPPTAPDHHIKHRRDPVRLDVTLQISRHPRISQCIVRIHIIRGPQHLELPTVNLLAQYLPGTMLPTRRPVQIHIHQPPAILVKQPHTHSLHIQTPRRHLRQPPRQLVHLPIRQLRRQRQRHQHLRLPLPPHRRLLLTPLPSHIPEHHHRSRQLPGSIPDRCTRPRNPMLLPSPRHQQPILSRLHPHPLRQHPAHLALSRLSRHHIHHPVHPLDLQPLRLSRSPSRQLLRRMIQTHHPSRRIARNHSVPNRPQHRRQMILTSSQLLPRLRHRLQQPVHIPRHPSQLVPPFNRQSPPEVPRPRYPIHALSQLLQLLHHQLPQQRQHTQQHQHPRHRQQRRHQQPRPPRLPLNVPHHTHPHQQRRLPLHIPHQPIRIKNLPVPEPYRPLRPVRQRLHHPRRLRQSL